MAIHSGQEHLGYSDKTIIALRKMLLSAVSDLQHGKEPPHIVREEQQADFTRLRSLKGILPADADWREIMAGLGPNDG